LLALVCAGSWAAATAAPAAAASPPASASSSPTVTSTPAATAAPRLTATDEQRAVTIALNDAVVGAVLAARQHEVVLVTAWRNGVSRDVMGADVLFSLASPGKLDGAVPFVAHSSALGPWPPLEIEKHHLRATDVTQLSVQVDLRLGKVVEIYPTRATVGENTVAPLSLVPWFTARAWVALPLFVVLAAMVASRARRRPKRGWGSADAVARGAFERAVVTLVLLGALGWFGYSVWTQVLHDAHGVSSIPKATSLAWPAIALPVLLFLGALRLEFAHSGRRTSWRVLLVFALAVAAGAVVPGHTVTNLTLGTYLLALFTALVAVRHMATPRALGQRYVTDFRFLSR
jgi:hypothetical protein